MKKYPLLFLSLSFLLICHGQASSGGLDTVATVGTTHAITFGELQARVHDRSYDRMFRTKPIDYAYRVALEDMIVDQLKRIDFFELGLQHDSTLLKSNQRLINEEVVINYFEREYVRKYVNAKTIRATYEQMKREMVCRRFFVDSTAIDPTRTHDTFDAITEKLEHERAAGKSFDDLVSMCRRWLKPSRVREVRDTVNWKKSVADESDGIIFTLRAGDLRILRSPASLEIIKIVKVNTLSVEPFEKVQDDIYTILRQQYLNKSYDEFAQAKAALVDEKFLKWNERGLKELHSWSNIPGFYGRIYADTLTSAIAEGRNIVLLKYRDGKVDLKEYLRLLNNVLILPARGQYTVADLKTYILEALRTDKLVKKANTLGLEKGVFNANTTDPDLKDRIVRLYNEREIDSKVPPLTEERIREFYDANKDSLYYQLAKVGIYAIISSDKGKIDSLWQIHMLGTPAEKLSRNWFVKTFIRDRNDDTIRSYLSTEKPFLGKAAFTLALNQAAGPIEYNDPDQGTQYAIIRCVERRPEKQLTLDEARKTIGNDFKEYEKKNIESATVKRLKTKYGFKIYDDVLMRNIPSGNGK